MKVVRETLYESYENVDNIELDEDWKSVKAAVTKPFRQRTPEEIAAEGEKIVADTAKLQKIEDVLKTLKNQNHLQNFINAKKLYDSGNKAAFFNFIVFLLDHWGDFKNNVPIYYKINPETGVVTDTTQRSTQNDAARKY